MQEAATQSAGLTPLGLFFIVTMCVLTWTFQRRYALIPLLITTCYMPLGQEFLILGLHFQFFRVLLLVGWCRVCARREMSDLELNPFDKLFAAWALVTVIMGTLTELSVDRFVNRAGEALNALGAYFLFRCWLKSPQDLVQVLRVCAWMILPLAASMILEKSTTRNIFHALGGVPEFTGVRDGRLRCQGAFRHPILAGTYGATFFPLFAGLWFQDRRNRWLAVAGAASAAVVTVSAASSGAFLAILGASAGLALWWFRARMRWFRWGLVLTLVGLSCAMKAPVWYLFAKLSDIAGGTGWYRSYLIDQAVGHFNEWWLVGSTYTAHWAPGGQVTVGSPNNMDIVNNYVAEGLGGGIVKLGLFLALIVKGFKIVGVWAQKCGTAAESRFVWAVGVGLFAHCVSFMSVSYFDQIVVMWYWLLAVLSMLVSQVQPEAVLQCAQNETVLAEPW